MKSDHHLIQPTCQVVQFQIEKQTAPIPIQKSFIQTVQDLLEENITDETFGILELCKAMGISRSQLYRKIKVASGVSTSIFIRDFRLNKARCFLKNSDMNISEITYEVGFKSPSYFSRLFLKTYGVAPHEIRRL